MHYGFTALSNLLYDEVLLDWQTIKLDAASPRGIECRQKVDTSNVNWGSACFRMRDMNGIRKEP